MLDALIHCKSIETVYNEQLKGLFRKNQPKNVLWKLTCTHRSQRFEDFTNSLNSSIMFVDKLSLTQRLITELVSTTNTRLSEVRELQFKKLTVALGAYPLKQHTTHSIKVEGVGFHSIVEHHKSPFSTEFYTNTMMSEIIENLVDQALGVIPV